MGFLARHLTDSPVDRANSGSVCCICAIVRSVAVVGVSHEQVDPDSG